MLTTTRHIKTSTFLAAGVFAAILAVLTGCGGGAAGTAGCNNLDPNRNPSLPSCGNSGTGGTPGTPVASATLKLNLSDASGANITTVSPDRAGTLQATVKDSLGMAVSNVAVTFTSSDKTGVFVPSSGTALTNTSGIAQLILPAGAQAGAFTVTANVTVGTKPVSGSIGYTVTFPSLSFSALTITPASLSAGGTASLSTTLSSGTGTFTPAQSVVLSSPCALAGKALISSPVITVNGVASTSYTDKGCGGADIITASTSLGGATFNQTGTITVIAATAGQIAFVSALPQNIALKGTGGAGRQESSTVTFKVLDKNGNPVSGQLVNFALTTYIGGLMLNQTSASTGADGLATTVIAAGSVNTPVRVTATLAGTSITTMSDQLVISTGIPDQNSFSLSTQIFNVENIDGCPILTDDTEVDSQIIRSGSAVRVSLADHFNNPVPDGTAVSFTAEGGTIDASCLTGWLNTTLKDGTVIKQKGIPGQCKVRFCVANPRPADGRITILAYALGEESFTDTNGNNLFEAAEAYQDLGEAFRNDRAITNRNANANWGVIGTSLVPANPDDSWSSGNATRVPGETFIDTNSSGTWDSAGDGIYNGVLKSPQSFNNQATHVRGALVQVLSGSTANFTALDPVPVTLSHCVDGTPFVNVPKTLRIAIRDGNPTIFAANTLPGNILPAGTTISFKASNGTILSSTSFIVPNTNEPSEAVWTYPVSIQSDATQLSLICSNPGTSGLLTVTVTTPMGIITTTSYVVTD